MTEDDTSGSYCCLWKRRTAFVTVALCGLVGFVLIAVLDLPWEVKRTMHVVDIANSLIPTKNTTDVDNSLIPTKNTTDVADRLIPTKDIETILPTTNASRLNSTKDLVEVREFKLKTYPPLIESGGDLVVSWERNSATTMTNHDYVTLSCGPTTEEGDYFYNKTVRVSDLSVRFSSLYMMRCNYTAIYYYYEEMSGKHRAIAKVEARMKEPAETPKHGHLSFTDDEKAMAIMFNSGTSKTPMVKYGMKPDDLKFYATGTSTTYGADDMCHAPATTVGQIYFRDPGYMHTVIMTDLKPNTYYFYQYGHEEHGLSQVHRFKSRPLSSYKYANFIAYGDMGAFAAFYGGSESTAARVFKDVVEEEYDSFLLHFGDISYARSQGHVWDQFFHLIEPYATRIVLLICAVVEPAYADEYGYTEGGKHDLSGGMLPYGGSFNPSWGNFGADSGGECGVPMHHRWHVPKTGNWIYWYSFNYGGIHVVQMSTEHNWTRGSEQYKWLENDLEQVDRNVTPWVVLTAHRMMYSSQLNIEPDMEVSYHFQEEVEDLIYKHRVNVMLVGHEHSYERTCPVYRKKCVENGKGTVHLVVGSAGYPLGPDGFSSKYGNYSLRHVNEYGYIRVTSSPNDMRFQFVLVENGNIYDEFTITPWEDS
ncbi:hypothetical protein DD238_006494 [Peronospora effusa]|uniref:Purple acid phosphatase n=2 Tax=Peronospora effusa TaxID=542832 RepID=A0A3M6VCG3_9STRA|nr:hypothetical protein DD238_006494 [Peronospora effusa]